MSGFMFKLKKMFSRDDTRSVPMAIGTDTESEVENAAVSTERDLMPAFDEENGIGEWNIPDPAENDVDVVTAHPVTHTEDDVDGTLPPDHPTQKEPVNERQVKNRADGYSFKVCDMNRLKRFIVIGTEDNTYYSTPGRNPQPGSALQNKQTTQETSKTQQNALENIQCVQKLLEQGRHEEVLETITKFSREGRVAKEEPILAILALCAGHTKLEVQKAAYTRVGEICNIPTKLFRFLELTQEEIYRKRKSDPPQPQKWIGEKRKRTEVESGLADLKLGGDQAANRPSTNTDEPAKKKKKKKKEKKTEFKRVNRKHKKSSGWGRLRRKGVSNFYTDQEKDGTRLVYLLTKYNKRHGWGHKEVLQFAHPCLKSGEEQSDAKILAIKYCTRGFDKMKKKFDELARVPGVSKPVSEVIDFIRKLEEVKSLSPSDAADLERLLEILKDYGKRGEREEYTTVNTWSPGAQPAENKEGRKSPIQIVREHIPTGFLNKSRVWEAMLVDMPMTALLRNLGKMSSLGLFDKPENERTAMESLTNIRKLKLAKIHPMKILVAMKTYEQGHGEKGALDWRVNEKIVDALDKAFYLSFKQPEVKVNHRTNKKYMLCLDVSGSMTFQGCRGCEVITPALASVAMAWVTWNVEDDVELVAFGGYLVDMKTLGFTKDMLLTEVLRRTRKISFGSTDCSLPMVHALKNRIEVDVFIVYTDSDTWSGRVHPVTALKDYNKEMGRVAKLVVLGMDSNGFTIADPQDPNMMDVVGFDPNVPEMIALFADGELSEVCGSNCEDCLRKTGF